MASPAVLVLTKFVTSGPSVPPEAPLVEIEARKGGLIAFLLTAMGIENKTRLVIARREVLFTSGSLFGEQTSMIPMTAVASAHGGFSKPIAYLIAAGFLILMAFGIMAGGNVVIGFVVLLIAVGCIIAYYLGKNMSLGIESSGGLPLGLTFKRSVIEGVTVDSEKVRQVVMLVRELVIQAQQKPA